MSLQLSPQAVPQVAPAASLGGATAPSSHGLPGGGTEPPFFRFEIRRALELHRKLAYGFAIAGLVLALAYGMLTWPRYLAQSEIYIQPTSDKVMNQSANSQRWPYDSNSYDSFIQQQVQLASNPDVLDNAMHKLPPGSWQKEGESEQAAAGRLGGAIKVERLGSSYLVAITAQARSADMAAQIANAVADSIVEKAAHEENAGDTQRLEILKAERDRIQIQLNADLAEQSELNKQLGMAAVGTEAPDLIDNAIGATREELIKARTDHDQAEARFASLEGNNPQSSEALDAEADELVASDPGLTSMKTSLNARRATLITQMANLTPTNPEYKLDTEELAQINGSLDSMMRDLRAKASAQIEQKLRADLERTAGVEAQLNGQLRQLADTAAGATPKLQRANDLVTDIVRLRNRFAAVDEELHDIMLQDSVPGAVHVSVVAVPPLHASFNGILRKSVPLALGGILLGLLAALLANHLDPRVYIASDVEYLLGFAPMIALPDFSEVSEGAFDEHILRLSTAIEHARKQGSLRNCIFTGTGAGAGVTTVVTRVRDMLVSMGRPTVLVDASGSHVTATSSVPAARAEGAVTSALVQSPGAERGTRSLALLERVKAGSAAQDENLVLSDTAPLLISAETEYLARFVDCVIVVVESGVTTRAQLQATADALQKLSVPAVGLVLNRVKLATADAGFRSSVEGTEAHVRTQGRPARKPKPSRSREFEEEAPVDPYQQEKRQPVASPQSAGTNPPPVMHPQVGLQPASIRQGQPAHRGVDGAKPEPIAFEPLVYRPEAAQPIVYAQGGPDEQTLARPEAFRSTQPAELDPATAETLAMERPSVSHLSMPRTAEAVTPQPAPSFAPEPTARVVAEPAPQVAPAPAPQFVVPGRVAVSAAPGPLPPAWKAPAAPELPPVPSADPNLPWWLSEAPLHAPLPAGGFQEAQEPARPASRLSGLRNALFGNGGRDRHAAEKHAEAETENPLPPVRREPFQPEPYDLRQRALEAFQPEQFAPQALAPEPLPPATYTPVYPPLPEPYHFPEPAAEYHQEGADARVAAEPEVLPPQPIVMPRDRTDVWGSEKRASRRRDRGDALDDDIQVLPSRRGQYRRKG